MILPLTLLPFVMGFHFHNNAILLGSLYCAVLSHYKVRGHAVFSFNRGTCFALGTSGQLRGLCDRTEQFWKVVFYEGKGSGLTLFEDTSLC